MPTRRRPAGAGRRGRRRDPGGGLRAGDRRSRRARLRRRDRPRRRVRRDARRGGRWKTSCGRRRASPAIPVCGPNGNGVVSVAARAPLWGDSVERLSPGPVAVITQSGNFGVNALGSDRGLGFHTVVSTGNSAVLEPSDWLEALAATEGVGSIALMLESDGDGARLARALATCAEREIGVAVLKVGSSEGGARAAGAHTGALAGDQRVFAALLEEAGAAQASEPGELLELARALAVPAARPTRRGGGRGNAARRRTRPLRAGARPRDPHLLGRGLGDGGGPGGGARAGAAGAVAGGAASGSRRCCRARRRSAIRSTTPRCSGTTTRRSRRSPRRSPRTRRSTSCCCSSTSRAGSTRRSPRAGKRCGGRCSPARRAGTRRRSSPRPCPSCSTRTTATELTAGRPGRDRRRPRRRDRLRRRAPHPARRPGAAAGDRRGRGTADVESTRRREPRRLDRRGARGGGGEAVARRGRARGAGRERSRSTSRGRSRWRCRSGCRSR